MRRNQINLTQLLTMQARESSWILLEKTHFRLKTQHNDHITHTSKIQMLPNTRDQGKVLELIIEFIHQQALLELH